jgi:hypothetical protein
MHGMLEATVHFLPRGGKWIFGKDWNMVENELDRSTHDNKSSFEGKMHGIRSK